MTNGHRPSSALKPPTSFSITSSGVGSYTVLNITTCLTLKNPIKSLHCFFGASAMALMGTVRLKPLEKLRISGKGSSFSSPVKGRQTEHLEYGYSFSRQSQFCWLRKPKV